MQVFALFHSSSLEHAINYIKTIGIHPHDVFVIPMEKHDVSIYPPDSRYPKNRDAIDKGFAFATAISVITAGIGFKLPLGPIIWGLFGAIGGFLIGFSIGTILLKKKNVDRHKSQTELPFILIVNCEESAVKHIEKSLREKGALGVNTPLYKGST